MPLDFNSFRHSPTEIKAIYTFRCAAPGCDEHVEQECFGQYMLTPNFPGEGWQKIGDVWLCPKHEYTISIDGKLWCVNGRAPELVGERR